MPKISSWLPRSLLASLAVVSVLASSASAQQLPAPTRIRGTIESVDGKTLSIKTCEGTDVKVNITDDITVIGIAKTSLSDIKQGSYIGVSGMPQPDGSQKAVAILIFPEAMRGVGEGHRPWDLEPNSTMTNATVAEQVAGTDGQTVTVKYKDGDKKILVMPATIIVTYKKSAASELKAGQKIFVAAAKKLDDGTLEAPNVAYGDVGVWR